VAINKIDRVGDRRALLPLMAAWRERGYDTLVPISALRNDGIELLLAEIAARLPEGPPPYPADALTDRSERFLVGELIREQVFQRTGEEIPYAVAVEVQSFEERTERGDVVIEAAIHVERESQKAILIGKGGRQIKELGTHARAEVARLLGRPAHLKLTVHVEPNWTRSPAGRRKLGYEP
jgi:GTP-binding protein Era